MDLSEMKGVWSLWQKVTSIEVKYNQNQTEIELGLPVTACNVCIEYEVVSISQPIEKLRSSGSVIQGFGAEALGKLDPVLEKLDLNVRQKLVPENGMDNNAGQ